MAGGLSGNQVDALARRLRDAPAPVREDLLLLEELLTEHVVVLDQVNAALRAIGLEPTRV
jgi:hypothetical protein